MSFTILGTGSALPGYILDNQTLSEMVDTSDEWIATRTGIRQRRICVEESLADLAALAAQRALVQAGIEPREIDLILCATLQGDYTMPSLACILQGILGASCPAMDLNAACTGFLYALDVAAGYFARGIVRHVLVLGADCVSKHVDWKDRGTCVLFGDGAGAVVLGPGDGLKAIQIRAQSNISFLNIPGKTSTFPHGQYTPQKETISMNGQEVYRFAVNSLCEGVRSVATQGGIALEDLRYVLAHQANQRILDTARAKLGLRPEQLPTTLERYGNTSSATLPILLDSLRSSGQLASGDLLALSAFGAGMTSGAALIQWA